MASAMSPIQQQRQVDKNKKMLQLACYIVNNPEALANKQLREYTLKDLSNLTSADMVHITSAILSRCDPSFAQRRALSCQARLPPWERLGLGTLTYDNTPDLAFKAARKLFPPGDDTLDLSVFLMPQSDIKRAKQVIIFLVGYLIAMDNFYEKFETEWNILNTENIEKNRLFEEIEELRNEVAKAIVELQTNKDSKPQLEQELKDTENELFQKMSYLSTKEEVCKSEKKNYENKAMINRMLEAELNNLQCQKTNLESQIVPAPEELDHLHKTEQQKLKDSEKKRELLGKELSNVEHKVQFLGKVIERAAISLNKFEELNALMENAGEHLEAVNRTAVTYEAKLKEIETLKNSIKSMESDHDRLQREIDHRRRFQEKEWEKLGQLLSTKQSKYEDLQFKLDETSSKLEEMEHNLITSAKKLQSNTNDIEQIKTVVIKECKEYQKILIHSEELYWRRIHACVSARSIITVKKKLNNSRPHAKPLGNNQKNNKGKGPK